MTGWPEFAFSGTGVLSGEGASLWFDLEVRDGVFGELIWWISAFWISWLHPPDGRVSSAMGSSGRFQSGEAAANR